MFFRIALGLAAFLWAWPATADSFIPTIYSDGYSCPSNCDAHVVFNAEHNGTKYASLPSSPRSDPAACRMGEDCRICFDDTDESCLNVVYRGNGPHQGRFDFTPAFYEATCSTASLPEVLAAQCRSFERQYESLTRDAVYCLNDPAYAGCHELLAAADSSKISDQPFWDECRDIGEAAFNRKYADEPARQRSLGCAYEKVGTGGPNSSGQTWKRLLPAVCQPGAYVGRDGLDCCDSNKMSLGGLGRECTNYLVEE
jgi:hypothetical protein